MKLFALPDNAVDRKDRAQWLSCPFDLAWGTPVVAVTPGTRTYTPQADGRTQTIGANDRTYIPQTDTRTHTAQDG